MNQKRSDTAPQVVIEDKAESRTKIDDLFREALARPKIDPHYREAFARLIKEVAEGTCTRSEALVRISTILDVKVGSRIVGVLAKVILGFEQPAITEKKEGGLGDQLIALRKYFDHIDNIHDEQTILLSDIVVQDSQVGDDQTTPAGERGLPRSRQSSPLPESGHEPTHPEAPSHARQITELLAQHTNASVADAETIVHALKVDAAALVELGKKLLKRKFRLSIKDFSEAELNDPQIIQDAHKTVNENRRTRIEDLNEEKANELRRARLLVQYDRGRRDRQSIPS